MTDSGRPLQTLTDDQKDSLLRQLLSASGIQDRFINFSGSTEIVPTPDLLAVLRAQGVDVSSIDAAPGIKIICEYLSAMQQEQDSSLLPPVVVFTRHTDSEEYLVQLNVQEAFLSAKSSWSIVSENRLVCFTGDVSLADLTEQKRVHINGTIYCQMQLPLLLTNLTDGYHQLTVSIGDFITRTIPLILAPSRCYEPGWSAAGKRLWGFSVQLYSFCTERSWGMGDFLDLGTLIYSAASQGASYLILNPLHAGALNQPEHCSPYSPVDRRRLNPLYIAPELEPEFAAGRASHWLTQNKAAAKLMTMARNSEWIDYASVAEVKIRVLAIMFEDFSTTGNMTRKSAFEHFKNTTHGGLTDYADWQAQQGCSAAGKFSNSADFYIYLQWLAETQLATCQQQALDAGMAVGLVRDLAVGSDRNGAEVSLSNGAFSTAASIGAPPDPLAPQGQNWGLPPMNPVKLRHQAYTPFIDLLRSNMQHSGALRIDHVMSLMRLWWCPYEKTGQGTYVMYPAEDLFAILRLESQRQQCLIIGEDLGIVPDEIRRHLNESGIYSNVLFYFEKVTADAYRSPHHYNKRALAMLANHDVPTLAAWWNGSDLLLRRKLDLIPDDSQLLYEINHRQVEKRQMLQLLESQWLLPASRFGPDKLEKQMDVTLAAALMRCIARSSAMMVSVQLEDLVLLELPVNIPGTSSEYKNWRRKMPENLLAIMHTESVIPMLESLRVERH